jgi:hypothetical protein
MYPLTFVSYNNCDAPIRGSCGRVYTERFALPINRNKTKFPRLFHPDWSALRVSQVL